MGSVAIRRRGLASGPPDDSLVTGCSRPAVSGLQLKEVRVPVDEHVVSMIAEVAASLNRPELQGISIDGKTSLVRDLKLDSLAVMDFVMALESRFDTIIPIDQLSDVETVGDLAHLLQPRPPAAGAEIR